MALHEIEYIRLCHTIANILLGIFIILILRYTHKIYKKSTQRIDNYYSEEVTGHIEWIHDSIYLFIGLAIIAFVSPFSHEYSLWLCVFYVLYQLAVYIYLYISMERFELTTLFLSKEREEQDTEPIPAIPISQAPLSTDTTQYIKKGIDEWIRKKGYTKEGITVKSVASEIYTNRTYLSSYINATYNKSFRLWITQLRIQEAKRIIYDNRNYTSAEIAEMVGFPSASTFIHNFTKLEEVSPKKWQESNLSIKLKQETPD